VDDPTDQGVEKQLRESRDRFKDLWQSSQRFAVSLFQLLDECEREIIYLAGKLKDVDHTSTLVRADDLVIRIRAARR
jgi:hypothetical protein